MPYSAAIYDIQWSAARASATVAASALPPTFVACLPATLEPHIAAASMSAPSNQACMKPASKASPQPVGSTALTPFRASTCRMSPSFSHINTPECRFVHHGAYDMMLYGRCAFPLTAQCVVYICSIAYMGSYPCRRWSQQHHSVR